MEQAADEKTTETQAVIDPLSVAYLPALTAGSRESAISEGDIILLQEIRSKFFSSGFHIIDENVAKRAYVPGKDPEVLYKELKNNFMKNGGSTDGINKSKFSDSIFSLSKTLRVRYVVCAELSVDVDGSFPDKNYTQPYIEVFDTVTRTVVTQNKYGWQWGSTDQLTVTEAINQETEEEA